MLGTAFLRQKSTNAGVPSQAKATWWSDIRGWTFTVAPSRRSPGNRIAHRYAPTTAFSPEKSAAIDEAPGEVSAWVRCNLR